METLKSLGCEATWVRISLVTNQFGFPRKARFSAAKVMYQANIYIKTNQNRELYSVRPQDFQHGRPDYNHFKTASYIGVA